MDGGFWPSTEKETCDNRQERSGENEIDRDGAWRGQGKDEKVDNDRGNLNGYLGNREDVAGLGVFEGDLILPIPARSRPAKG